jgi:hypothetical protein
MFRVSADSNSLTFDSRLPHIILEIPPALHALAPHSVCRDDSRFWKPVDSTNVLGSRTEWAPFSGNDLKSWATSTPSSRGEASTPHRTKPCTYTTQSEGFRLSALRPYSWLPRSRYLATEPALAPSGIYRHSLPPRSSATTAGPVP